MRTLRGACALLACLGLLPAAARAEADAAPDRVQIYIMPDTQSWAWNQGGTSLETWRGVAQALCRQRQRFAMVLHTGDLVDTPRTRPEEWTNALSVMKELDACAMPYAVAFGNHDYDNYPAPSADKTAAGDERWQAVTSALAYHPAERAPSGRGGLYPLVPGWFVLTADLQPDAADLRWIAAEIAERPGARFVLLHHECVKASGVSYEWCSQLFEKHPEIWLAISGHWLGNSRNGWNEVRRANGSKLVALYQNYQHVPDLAGWGVVLELEPGSGDLCVWTEDPRSGSVGHPAASSSLAGAVRAGPGKRCFRR